METSTINHIPEKRQFEMSVNGEIATVSYTQEGNTLYLIHSEVPYNLRGQGIGKELVEKTLEYIQENDLKAKPICSYIRRVAKGDQKWESILID